LEYCQSIPNERKFVYDGVVGFYEGFKFCSGAGFLLNSNSVKLILDSKNLLDENPTKWGLLRSYLKPVKNISEASNYAIHAGFN
jgi:hypothetical protein